MRPGPAAAAPPADRKCPRAAASSGVHAAGAATPPRPAPARPAPAAQPALPPRSRALPGASEWLHAGAGAGAPAGSGGSGVSSASRMPLLAPADAPPRPLRATAACGRRAPRYLGRPPWLRRPHAQPREPQADPWPPEPMGLRCQGAARSRPGAGARRHPQVPEQRATVVGLRCRSGLVVLHGVGPGELEVTTKAGCRTLAGGHSEASPAPNRRCVIQCQCS